jgi:hypothetical protein
MFDAEKEAMLNSQFGHSPVCLTVGRAQAVVKSCNKVFLPKGEQSRDKIGWIQLEIALHRSSTSALQFSAVQCSAVQCSAVQCSAVQCSAVQCSAVRCSAVQCSAVQCSAVQCSAVNRLLCRGLGRKDQGEPAGTAGALTARAGGGGEAGQSVGHSSSDYVGTLETHCPSVLLLLHWSRSVSGVRSGVECGRVELIGVWQGRVE